MQIIRKKRFENDCYQLFPKTKQKIIEHKHFNSQSDKVVVGTSISKLVDLKVYLPCQVISKNFKK